MPPKRTTKRRTAQEQLPPGHGKKNKTKNSAEDVDGEEESDISEKQDEVEEDEEEIQMAQEDPVMEAVDENIDEAIHEDDMNGDNSDRVGSSRRPAADEEEGYGSGGGSDISPDATSLSSSSKRGKKQKIEMKSILDEDDDEDDADDDSLSDDDGIDVESRSEAGIIERIHVKNFMNHRELDLKFNRNVNFIHGPNGSGKSAVLAALQICLGARAHATHRGSLKALVRRNAAGGHTGTAEVRVTLLNTGPDAFRPEQYGKHIIVERKFSASGTTNTYRLLNEKGIPQTSEKRELNNMMDRLSIQVENPVCILDQENAKEFIKGNEKDKYKFFSKATDLTRVLEMLEDSKAHLAQSYRTVEQSKRQVAHHAVDLENAQNALKELQKVLQIDDKIKMYECGLFWKEVERLEDDLEDEEEKVALIDRKVKEAALKVEKAETAHKEQRTSDEIGADVKRLEQNAKEAKENIDRLNKEIAQASKPVKIAQKDLDISKRKIKELRGEIKDLQDRIDEAEAERQQHSGEEEQKRKDELNGAKDKAIELKEGIKRCTERLEEMEEGVQSALEDEENKHREFKAEVESRNDLKAQRHKLQSAQTSPAQQWGSKVDEIRREINKQRSRFDQEPVGPLGLHVKLKPQMDKWAKPISACLNAQLRSYAVTSGNDSKILMEILHKCNVKHEHRIIKIVFKPRVGSPGQPPLKLPRNLLTVAQAVQIDHDVAFNALCEQSGIDGCVLAHTADEAEGAVLDDSRGRGNLKLVDNASRAYDLSGAYTSARGGNKFYIKYDGRVISFGKDVKQQIADLDAEIDAMETRCANLSAEWKEAKKTLAQVQRERSDAVNSKRETMKALKKAESEIEKRTEELKDLQNDNAIDTSEWEEEIKELQFQMDDHEESAKEATKRIKDLSVAVDEKKAEKTQYEKTSNDFIKKMSKAEEEMNAALRHADELKKKVDKAREKQQQVIELLEQVATTVEVKKTAVEKATANARKYMVQNLSAEKLEAAVQDDGEYRMRIGEKKSAEYIQNKIEALKEQKVKGLKDLPPGQRDLDAAIQKAAKAQHVYDEKMKEIKKVEHNVGELEHDVKKRTKKWKDFRRSIARRTDVNFDAALQQKGQSGTLDFNHAEGTLSLNVQKDNRDTQSQISNVKLLSGGERSYTTLALLLSLGDSLECPFRIMDEFDVFMDSVSRKVALEQLVEEGKRRSERQFILITPQKIDAVIPGPMVKIIKLSPPIKNEIGQQSIEPQLLSNSMNNN